MTSSTKNITAEDVKDKLFKTLKSRGVVDSLKSQLRKQLICELQDSTGLPVLQSAFTASASKQQTDHNTVPLFQWIANSIVAEHLKTCNYEYTLSTFLPESGTSPDKVFSTKDILHLLHVSSDSKLYKTLENYSGSSSDSKGFLWQFLIEITALHTNGKRDAENQTEETSPTRTGSLEEKLSNVEREFSQKLRLFQYDKNYGMEEKMIAVEKKYEMQKRQELQQEIKRFKANELSKLRLEEREKYEAEIKKIRLEYDQEHNLKQEALRAMEKEMLESIKRLQQVHESESYAERQKMLQEMQSFKERDADLRNKIALQERSQKLEEERIRTEAEQLKTLELALKEKEKLQEQRFKSDIERFKAEYENQFKTRQEELLRQESRLEAERSRMMSERDEYLKCQENLAACKEKNVQLQSSVETSRLLLENLNKQKTALEDKLSGMKDYPALKEKEIIFKRDIEHLTQRLTETNKHWKEQEKGQLRLVKELTDKASKPSKEVVTLRKEVKDLKEKSNLKEKSLNEARKTIESRLSIETQRADHFQKLYEEQLCSQRLMEREIENLKMIQQQTEQLLSMDLRQQKADNSARLLVSRKMTSKTPTVLEPSGHEVPTRNYETDESSAIDESSLVSLTEEKKIFNRLEREAEALDASYRDFQSRMRASERHPVASIPSSMTFRRLPSYHSFYSVASVPSSRQVWTSSTAQDSKVDFRPLTRYDESGILDHLKPAATVQKRSKSAILSHSDQKAVPDGKAEKRVHQSVPPSSKSIDKCNGEGPSGMLVSDKSRTLTVEDLVTNALPSPQISNTGGIKTTKHEFSSTFVDSSRVQVKNVNKQKSTEPEEASTENNKYSSESSVEYRPKTDNELISLEQKPTVNKPGRFFDKNRMESINVENMVVEKKLLSNVGVDREVTTGAVELNGSVVHSESRRSSNRSVDQGSHVSDSGKREHGETSLDGVWERRENQGLATGGGKRSSIDLDMEELEERRRKDEGRSKDEDEYQSEGEITDSGESLDEQKQERYKDQEARDTTLQLSADTNEKVKGINNDASDGSDDDGEDDDEVAGHASNQDPSIDPVMLKYMEMIKQRRQNTAKNNDNHTKEESSNKAVVLTDQDQGDDSNLSFGNGDEDVSVGKLSDEDFSWE